MKADVDNSVGKEWQDKFEVCCLPTLIVFSPDGYEITRKQGGISSSEFLNLLENAIGKKATLIFNNSTTSNSSHQKSTVQQNHSKPKPIFVKHNIIDTVPINQKWTLLIGKYSQIKDANKQIKKLKNQLPDDDVLLIVKKENNKIIYHVTMGEIKQEQEAIKLRKKLLSKNIGCTLLKD